MNIRVNEPVSVPSELRVLERRLHLEKTKADHMDLFGEEPPAELLTPYRLGAESLSRSALLQKKYTDRARNISRCWNRTQLFLPELLLPGAPQRVLEMSTAHGAMLEILRHYGHDVTGNDYANMMKSRGGRDSSYFRKVNDEGFARFRDDYGNRLDPEADDAPDWPYRHITNAINLPMEIFDAGVTPYPLVDKSFDVLICFQAIEHYCRPSGWAAVLDEFCRITRKTIVVVPNPLTEGLQADPDYSAEYRQVMLDLRRFDRNGFRCTSVHMHWSQPSGFKLTAV
ncbi:hypothetical protein BV394_07170 [Brevirhabdus pacifica]|uniref:Uncharacterized protein n=1 Tax=Brevirhabdus pacifica TaxID=1267768 RepID=A0A1U7DHQ3_9RHOB|nr:class I SAM-dependent methyltransferase [Brevirhabdus pacifica]APX89520.1 hypothetical protein BV394_07170 [Brevirhabdus pacifica]OWU76473.1 hypothetical protein ATO5_09130 [Loktanella sp. 22II-4b]PJJ85823.1 methyltransferase family protein [Brevirhabdus pacifica]